MSKGFGIQFSRRSAICFFLICIMFFICYLRIFAITTNEKYSATATKQNSYTLTISTARGTIYDRNMRTFTNREYKIMAAVSPTPKAITVISGILEGERLQGVLEKLKSGKPALCEVEKEIECDGIICVKVPVYMSENALCVQLLGYTDSTGHGVSGIEKAYDEILFCNGKYEINYATDGHFNLLPGVDGTKNLTNAVYENGVVTTIDMNIQQIAENAARTIKKGAVLISEVKSGEIVAMVSKPTFDPLNLGDALNNQDSPFLNRCLYAYNVGSVFKPCVAAAALEMGSFNNFTHNCTGKTIIDSHTFNCHNKSGHGVMDLGFALAQSCNTFFYNFSLLVGAKSIYSLATTLGFGNSITLAKGITTTGENISSLKSVENSNRALVNLAIGQGDLLASPVVLLNLYNAIAGDGTYVLPTTVKYTLKDGKRNDYKKSSPTRVLSQDNAAILRQYLKKVIVEGTGTKAQPKNCTAAGKTATAETGWKNKEGKLVSQSWFCGFFPFENPKYTVIVLAEDSVSGGEDCAPVFKEICEEITKLNP